MTEIIFISAIALLIAPLTLIKEINHKICMLLVCLSFIIIVLTSSQVYNVSGLLGVKELLVTFSFCLVLNIDNIISYIVVVESFNATTEEKEKAINLAILSAIFFREVLIFVGMSFSGYTVWLFKIFTVAICIYAGKKIYLQSDFIKNKNTTDTNDGKDTQNSITLFKSNFRFSKIVTVIIFAETLFSLDSTNMIIVSTQNQMIAHIANLAAMCTLKPITTLIQITNRDNKYLEDRIWIPVVFVLTKTILWG